MATGPLRNIPALCGFLAALAAAPAAAETPLSIIDWLESDEQVQPAAIPPATGTTAAQPRIDVQPLADLAQPVGLVPPTVTGLPVALWQNSDPQVTARLIGTAPVTGHPALQSLLYSMMLTETLPTADTDDLLLARIDKLLDLGALDPAKALIEVAGPTSSPALFARWTDTAFLTGSEDDVCAVLSDMPHLAPDRATLIFCTARTGDLNGASLLFDTSAALGDLDTQVAPALDRFLHPELFEDAAPLPQPRNPSPLLFRLYESIGERLPTASLSRRFAASDLRDVAGWKAQLEAAERLARTGAISSNTFLGLYTDRLPAASGGIWDRVAALQRFETALGTGSPDAIAKTLPQVWDQLGAVGLHVTFADLFGESLAAVTLQPGRAAQLALEAALLSPGYETLSRTMAPQGPREAFWIAVAQGTPETVPAPTPLAEAVAAGFQPVDALPRGLDRARLGETVLRAIALYDRGATGNLQDLTDALRVFRAVGLEDVARRAALQLLIAEEG